MKILFVAYQDYANVSTDIAKAINEWIPECEARVCSCIPHPFGYANKHHLDYDTSSDDEKRDMSEWIRSGVDIMIWAEEGLSPTAYYSFYGPENAFRSTILFGQFSEIHKTARCMIFHAGVAFRTFHAEYNPLDAQFFERQIVSPDLWRLSRDLSGIICFGKPMAVSLDRASDLWDIRREHIISVCHSPTNYTHKGTSIIEGAVAIASHERPIEYRRIGGPAHRNEHVPHNELRELRAQCHVYIDQFSSVGGIGISSIEALSDGMVTLCSDQMIPKHAWVQGGLEGDCPIISLAPTGDNAVDTQSVAHALVHLDDIERRGMQGAFWARRNFHPKTFANRFIRSLLLK